MFFEGGGYKSRAGCHGARTVYGLVKTAPHAKNHAISKKNAWGLGRGSWPLSAAPLLRQAVRRPRQTGQTQTARRQQTV